MRFLTTCAAGVLALAAATAAMAQPRPPGGSPPPDASGQPGDDMRRPSLFVSPMGQPFRANASGARGIDLWFTAADTDYDTRISRAEFIANANAFFALVDANQDGALTSVEDTAYWRTTAPELVSGYSGGEPIGNTIAPTARANRNDDGHPVVTTNDVDIHGRHRGGPVERPVGAQAYGLLGDAEPIMSCDSNFDRRITLAEFDACADRRFAMLDANHDGFITPDEATHYRSGGDSDVIRVSR